jgi:rhamnose utilization protein RhaD (predicted bifunctional aldolase and dehydrogenase)
VLWVKGSGGDLRTAKRDGFASLYAEQVRALKPRYGHQDEVKTAIKTRCTGSTATASSA